MNQQQRHCQGGFTLIELLVAVTIIAILIGIAIPVISVMRRSANQARTQQQLEQLRDALSRYLTTYPRLGDPPSADSADFAAQPWKYLSGAYGGRDAYLDMTLRDLCMADGSPAATVTAAVAIRDPSGKALQWRIENGPGGANGYRVTARVMVWSSVTNDAIRYVATEGGWTAGTLDALKWW